MIRTTILDRPARGHLPSRSVDENGYQSSFLRRLSNHLCSFAPTIRLSSLVAAAVISVGCSQAHFEEPGELRAVHVPIVRAGLSPSFELSDLQGRPVRLSDFRGRTVLLNFWASWCSPCIQELREFDYLAKDYADAGLSVLAISIDGNIEDAREVVRRLNLSYPVLSDPLSMAISRFGAPSVPTTFIVDPEGYLRVFPDPLHLIPDKRVTGYRSWSSSRGRAIISALLEEKERKAR